MGECARYLPLPVNMTIQLEETGALRAGDCEGTCSAGGCAGMNRASVLVLVVGVGAE